MLTFEMARRLDRHRSTIYREIKCNTSSGREPPDYDGYYSTVAHDISKERRHRLRKLWWHPNLRTEIINQLEARWSPEQIAGRLLLDDTATSASVKRQSIASFTPRKIMGLASIVISRKRVANVVRCAPGNRYGVMGIIKCLLALVILDGSILEIKFDPIAG
ncbi:IS30 family transposase (plasmid) [Rhizobium grahamii CCGE 502]|uniref:IS30 family transposase n=1 Tax=Rhizobium grahamii CCGE 502 TaxID=990285 RepID=S3H5E5_9HYPH|nr:IS30 family transposase [Rhizobium grahamii CCGE 502]